MARTVDRGSEASRRALGLLREHWILVAVLVGGLVLRLAVMSAVRPITYGLYDSGTYLLEANRSLFYDVHHSVGYPFFLRIVAPLAPTGMRLALLQHLLGLGAAVLLYVAALRFHAPKWGAAIPAAAIALNLDVIALEHSILSEALYLPAIALFLFAAASIYAARRRRSFVIWGLVLGLAAAVAWTARYPGLALVVVAPLAALVLVRHGRAARAIAVGCAVLGALAVMAPYLIAQNAALGIGLLQVTPGGGWNAYASIAPTADCRRFTPPPGTRVLCQTAAQRAGKSPEFYSWDGRSPARRLEPRGFPFSDAKFRAFADAASAAGPAGPPPGPLRRAGDELTSLVRKAGVVFGPQQVNPQLNYRVPLVESNERALAGPAFRLKPMTFNPPLQPLLDVWPLLRLSGGLALAMIVAGLLAAPRLWRRRLLFLALLVCVIAAWIRAGQLPRYNVPVFLVASMIAALGAAGFVAPRRRGPLRWRRTPAPGEQQPETPGSPRSEPALVSSAADPGGEPEPV